MIGGSTGDASFTLDGVTSAEAPGLAEIVWFDTEV